MNKFFTINVKPTMTFATRATGSFDNGDLILNWFAFDVPNGGNNLVSAYALTETVNGILQGFNIEVIFAKDLVVGNKIMAPAALGNPDATASGGAYQNHLIGFLQSSPLGQGTSNLDYAFMQRLSTIEANGNRPDIVIQGHPDTGTSTGLSRVYVAVLTDKGAPDFSSAVRVSGAGTAGDATLTVDSADASRILSAGDQLIDEDEQELGTVEKVSSTVITFDKNKLLNSVADNKLIASKSPLKFVFGFER
mgnify:CR=1 FL=1